MPTTLRLPLWYDLHAHFRQGALLEPLISAHRAMGCAGFVAMPNTKPPVTRINRADNGSGWSIDEYQEMLHRAGAASMQVIVPLYLSAATTPEMIEHGAQSGLLRACKYYPPHGTTGADSAAPLQQLIDNGVIAAMEESDVTLCLHGEMHDLPAERYFDQGDNAEARFYREEAPRLLERFPRLRVVAEHVTTASAVELVQQAGERVAATVTPQHLLYTVGHLLQGLRYHLYCLPLLKFEADREALRSAVTAADNRSFFAGTDSAPHTTKATACGCAAGCYTGGIAPQLYAEGFEQAGIDLNSESGQQRFERFLYHNGRDFYALPESEGHFVLRREAQSVLPLESAEGRILPLPLGLGRECGAESVELPWSIALESDA